MKTVMKPESFYNSLDAGIRFAVKVLHAAGIETCQSCEGGKGHSYIQPTIDIHINSVEEVIFAALAALAAYGLPVESISVVWNVQGKLINEKLGRITFFRSMDERADSSPMFVWGYMPYRKIKEEE